MQKVSKEVHCFVHNADVVPRLLGNEYMKLSPKVLEFLKQVIAGGNSSEARLLLQQFLENSDKPNFMDILGGYRPFGEYYLLFDKDLVIRAQTDQDKRNIVAFASLVSYNNNNNNTAYKIIIVLICYYDVVEFWYRNGTKTNARSSRYELIRRFCSQCRQELERNQCQ